MFQPASQSEKRRHPHDTQWYQRTGMRRKTVQTSGETDLQPTTENIAQLYQTDFRQRLSISEDALFNKRPEQLSVAEFIDLTNQVEEALKTATTTGNRPAAVSREP